MTKKMMLDLIRRIKDDVEMQNEDTEFKFEDLNDLANYEYEWMISVAEKVKKMEEQDKKNEQLQEDVDDQFIASAIKCFW